MFLRAKPNVVCGAGMKIDRQKFPASGAHSLGRQDRADFHLQCLRQNNKFGICDAAKLCFNLGERASAHIPAENRAAGGKHFLRQFLLVTQLSDLRPDNVFQFDHAPKTELDSIQTIELNCSNIGAMYGLL